MTCVAAWLQAALPSDNTYRMMVMDESWRMFSHLPIAAWMQQSFKLSHASATTNVVVMHRLSDLASAGSAGSHQVRLAEGLRAGTETRVIYGQPRQRCNRPESCSACRTLKRRCCPSCLEVKRSGRWERGRSWWSINCRRPRPDSWIPMLEWVRCHWGA